MRVSIKKNRFIERFNQLTRAALLATVLIVCLEAVWWVCSYYN